MLNRILLSMCFGMLVFTVAGAQEFRWFKGNTHTHTTNSDGNELPRRVVRWYLDHEYNFLFITDHDTITDITYLDTDRNDDFILIPGEEVTDSYKGKPAHVNALGIRTIVRKARGNSMLETLQNNVDAIRSADGIAQINHPSYRYAFDHSVLSQLRNVGLVEILNVSKDCHNYAAGGYLSVEDMWDSSLTRGVMFYGVISDDTHDYIGEFSADKSYPGKGWIMVRANELSGDAILAALSRGDFYATTGISLRDVQRTNRDYTVEIQPWENARYTIRFIGKNGTVLHDSYDLKSTYAFRGDEGYVRVKIFSSTGDVAFTQPVMVK